ncbi:DUF2971 domain-containing protein [Cobetia sp. 5-11-6-3]|uniref:DUF2971 domain-containing protein n=1 Tax=Cobetia sp. 5-11-6-3 TaxID=2737458 RepID=UPI00159668E3|nr:DUF2971 domain-containing protein [Cobetia sp. 5-11-6-3]
MESSKLGLLKFCGPTENSISNLEKGVIFCQHYSAYNDPFEFWHHIYTNVPDRWKEPKRYAAALDAWGVLDSPPEDEVVFKYFDGCVSYDPGFQDMCDKTRISCFGSERDSMLMWSHYADGLRGFCVVFDEDVLLESELEPYLLNVDYQDYPPVIDCFVYVIARDQYEYHCMAIEEASALADQKYWIPLYKKAKLEAFDSMAKTWQQVFATKPLAWKYERERRLLVMSEEENVSPSLLQYSPKAVREIILGERMEYGVRQRINSILRESYPHVPVRTARRVQGVYSINID